MKKLYEISSEISNLVNENIKSSSSNEIIQIINNHNELYKIPEILDDKAITYREYLLNAFTAFIF